MKNLKIYDDFKKSKVMEQRVPLMSGKADLEQVRQSEPYRLLLNTGWKESEDDREIRDRLGNLRFTSPDFSKDIAIDSYIKIIKGDRSMEIPMPIKVNTRTTEGMIQAISFVLFAVRLDKQLY